MNSSIQSLLSDNIATLLVMLNTDVFEGLSSRTILTILATLENVSQIAVTCNKKHLIGSHSLIICHRDSHANPDGL